MQNTIRNYVAKLLPRLNKASVLEDLRMAHTSFSDAQDAYKRALDKMPGKFQEDSLNELSKTYASLARTGSGKNILANIYASIPDVLQSIETLETVASGELEEVIATQGLNYKKAALIQLADALVFASRFTIKVLKHCVRVELNAAKLKNNIEPDAATELDVYEAEKLSSHMAAYGLVMNALTNSKTIVERLEKIPDILVTGTDYGVLKNTVGKSNLEPFDLTAGDGLNFTWTPWYQASMNRMIKKTERAEEAKNELQVVRIQLYQLENAQRGKDDAATEQQIRILKLRSARLTRDIERNEA